MRNHNNNSAGLISIVALVVLLLLSASVRQASAGPGLYGVCQAGCCALAVSCYSAAGFTFGTVTAGAGVPAAILACNAALGVCSAKCAAVTLFAPTL
jgi:hypothetical protein